MNETERVHRRMELVKRSMKRAKWIKTPQSKADAAEYMDLCRETERERVSKIKR